MKKMLTMIVLATLVVGLGATPVFSQVDQDCTDYATQPDAQDDLGASDPYGLDGDNDGKACEDLPGEVVVSVDESSGESNDGSAATSQYAQYPEGGQNLPPTGGLPILPLAAGAFIVALGVTLLLYRR